MFRIVETTTDQLMIAEKISKSIINSKLSPCVNIIDGIKSYYIWKDKIVSTDEYTIKIKTVEHHINKISSIIKEKSNSFWIDFLLGPGRRESSYFNSWQWIIWAKDIFYL